MRTLHAAQQFVAQGSLAGQAAPHKASSSAVGIESQSRNESRNVEAPTRPLMRRRGASKRPANEPRPGAGAQTAAQPPSPPSPPSPPPLGSRLSALGSPSLCGSSPRGSRLHPPATVDLCTMQSHLDQDETQLSNQHKHQQAKSKGQFSPSSFGSEAAQNMARLMATRECIDTATT